MKTMFSLPFMRPVAALLLAACAASLPGGCASSAPADAGPAVFEPRPDPPTTTQAPSPPQPPSPTTTIASSTSEPEPAPLSWDDWVLQERERNAALLRGFQDGLRVFEAESIAFIPLSIDVVQTRPLAAYRDHVRATLDDARMPLEWLDRVELLDEVTRRIKTDHARSGDYNFDEIARQLAETQRNHRFAIVLLTHRLGGGDSTRRGEAERAFIGMQLVDMDNRRSVCFEANRLEAAVRNGPDGAGNITRGQIQTAVTAMMQPFLTEAISRVGSIRRAPRDPAPSAAPSGRLVDFNLEFVGDKWDRDELGELSEEDWIVTIRETLLEARGVTGMPAWNMDQESDGVRLVGRLRINADADSFEVLTDVRRRLRGSLQAAVAGATERRAISGEVRPDPGPYIGRNVPVHWRQARRLFEEFIDRSGMRVLVFDEGAVRRHRGLEWWEAGADVSRGTSNFLLEFRERLDRLGIDVMDVTWLQQQIRREPIDASRAEDARRILADRARLAGITHIVFVDSDSDDSSLKRAAATMISVMGEAGRSTVVARIRERRIEGLDMDDRLEEEADYLVRKLMDAVLDQDFGRSVDMMVTVQGGPFADDVFRFADAFRESPGVLRVGRTVVLDDAASFSIRFDPKQIDGMAASEYFMRQLREQFREADAPTFGLTGGDSGLVIEMQ